MSVETETTQATHAPMRTRLEQVEIVRIKIPLGNLVGICLKGGVALVLAVLILFIPATLLWEFLGIVGEAFMAAWR